MKPVAKSPVQPVVVQSEEVSNSALNVGPSVAVVPVIVYGPLLMAPKIPTPPATVTAPVVCVVLAVVSENIARPANVCTPLNVCAASVRAIVAFASGTVTTRVVPAAGPTICITPVVALLSNCSAVVALVTSSSHALPTKQNPPSENLTVSPARRTSGFDIA